MKFSRLSSPALLPSVQICPGCGKSVCTVAGRAAHLFLCGPSGVNSALLASPLGNDGRGVCFSVNPLGSVNRDKTGLSVVRKGVTVDYGGIRFVVERVRRGVAYGNTTFSNQYFFAPANAVRVMF